jgi:anti-sigma-K factor RskA
MYTLGALEPGERAAVERHIATCDRCSAAVAEAERLVAVLPLSVEPIAPSPQLRERVLARVDEDLRTYPSRPQRADERGARREAWYSGLVRAWHGLGALSPAIALVSLVLLVAVAGYAWSLQRQVAQQRAEVAFLSRPDLRTATLPGTSLVAPGAQAKLITAPAGNTALLALSGLKPLGPDQTYQFWLIRDGQATPAGLFNVDPQGMGSLFVQANSPLNTYQQAGITVEPAGGSRVPNVKAMQFVGPLQ